MARARKPLRQSKEHLRVAYYGPNGSGKTTAAAHMAHQGEVAVVAAEPGFRVGRLASLGIPVDNLQLALATYDRDTPDVNHANLDRLFWDLKQEYTEARKTAPVGLLLDTVTEIQGLVTDEVRIEELARVRRQNSSYDESDYFIDVAWHGIVVAKVNKLLRQYRDLPCHWAIVCQEEHREPFRGKGSRSVGPAVSPGVQSSVMGFSDFVIQLETLDNPDDPKNPWRIGWTVTHGSPPNKAKDRDGILPARMAFPTFDRVLAYYDGDLRADTDPLQQELEELIQDGTLAPQDPAQRPRRVRASELAAQKARTA